jgi:phenylacetate-CoA ligase
MQSLEKLKIKVIGPLPPPSGGMANQTVQLARLLSDEGAEVEVVCVNPPYWPKWISHVRGVRALFRLVPYIVRLTNAAEGTELFHIMANSGWAWHLFAAPAVWVAQARGVTAVVNYRGGDAAAFLRKSLFWVKPTLKRAGTVVVPSAFLENVFERNGIPVLVVPNIVDLERFSPRPDENHALSEIDCVSLLVSRNLELVYDIETAIRAFQLVRGQWSKAKLFIVGTGPEEQRLKELAKDLAANDSVTFLGRIPNERMPEIYRSCDIVINPSLVDNMPISILEALASGVPVVSTNVGGVPVLVEHNKTALLVPPKEPKSMANAVLELCRDYGRYTQIRDAGLQLAKRFSWESVRGQWVGVYSTALDRSRVRRKRIADA